MLPNLIITLTPDPAYAIVKHGKHFFFIKHRHSQISEHSLNVADMIINELERGAYC